MSAIYSKKECLETIESLKRLINRLQDEIYALKVAAKQHEKKRR